MKHKLMSGGSALGMWLFSVITAVAADPTGSANNITSPITSAQAVVDLMCRIFAWMFYSLMALSFIMILFAAFNYITGGDNAEKIGKANKIILYAAIGVTVALIAKGFPYIVATFVGGTYSFSLSKC